MGHPAIENKTPFAFEALYLVDEEFRPLVVPVIKGTFLIDKKGVCRVAEEQIPLNVSGESWGEDPATSSYKYEPEVAFFKPATDVVLVGHAYAVQRGTTQMSVGLVVGPLRKGAVVFGDRVWFRAAGIPTISRPLPFERIPLVYERAFGGWDKSDPDPNRHTFEPRNPVGVGFRAALEDGMPLPNIEDPRALLNDFADRPPPAGFGFVSPHWAPRALLAGTFDDSWQKERAPLLPRDFDRGHLNAASAGLVAAGYLRGDESVTALGVVPGGTLSFSLPGVRPPSVTIACRDGTGLNLTTNLDTVIVEPDERRCVLLWRTYAALRTGPHDVTDIDVAVDAVDRALAAAAHA